MNKRRNKFNKNKGNYSFNSDKGERKLNGQIKSVVTTNFPKKLGIQSNENKSEQKKIISIPKRTEFNSFLDKKNQPSRQIDFNQGKKQNEKIRVKRSRTIIPYTINKFQNEICPICNKIITNMSQAIVYKEKGKAAHFDCVFNEVKKHFFLKPDERFSYIGNGTFAVIGDYKEDGKMKFVIKDKVQYCDKIAVK